MDYEHTQTGPVAVFVLIFFMIILSVVVFAGGDRMVSIASAAAMLVVLAVVVAFNRLTVRVDSATVFVFFGWGWPARRIALADVVETIRVRNRWWYGFGIRMVPQRTWMYNVWGLDAVELGLASGSRFRIGTNDAEALLTAMSLRR